MAAITRKQYKGAAAQTTITSGINAAATTVQIAANTGWPTGAEPFYVVISPGTAAEEKCLATISSTTLTLTRAQDDTTAQTHSSGATIYPVFTADEADEANFVASRWTTKGDLVTFDGTDVARQGVGTNGHVLTADSTVTNGIKWALSPETDLVTTKGDLLVATAADTLARLGVGINGYRVTAASGETTGLKYDMPSVPVFADTTARDNAFGGAGEKTLADGQMCYISAAPKRLQVYDGSAWLDYDIAYQAFTPTFTNVTVGNGTVDFEYARFGKMVHYLGTFTLGSTSSITGTITLTTPTTQDGSAGGVAAQSATMTDSGVTDFLGGVFLNGGTTIFIGATLTSATYASWAGSSATVPLTWGNGDSFKFSMIYKTA